MNTQLLTVSPSPHIHKGESVSSIMYGVVISLLPAVFMSVYVFGISALLVMLYAVVSCLVFEFLINKYLLKKSISVLDGSAVITGILLAFNLPNSIPWWAIVVGSLVAIGIGKMAFGGLGNNPFNPALVGRVFLLISFPVPMTSWPVPFENRMSLVDGVTGATPLGMIKEGLDAGQTIPQLMEKLPPHFDFFIGNMGGSLGEISGFALLIGFLYLIYRKIVTWHIPVAMLGTIALFTGIFWLSDPNTYADPLFHILTGGILLGAFYMATDYVTSPMSYKGMILYGMGIGVVTVVIRLWGAYPEGVSFAILIMNAFVPLINKYIKPKRFGAR